MSGTPQGDSFRAPTGHRTPGTFELLNHFLAQRYRMFRRRSHAVTIPYVQLTLSPHLSHPRRMAPAVRVVLGFIAFLVTDHEFLVQTLIPAMRMNKE